MQHVFLKKTHETWEAFFPIRFRVLETKCSQNDREENLRILFDIS